MFHRCSLSNGHAPRQRRPPLQDCRAHYFDVDLLRVFLVLLTMIMMMMMLMMMMLMLMLMLILILMIHVYVVILEVPFVLFAPVLAARFEGGSLGYS